MEESIAKCEQRYSQALIVTRLHKRDFNFCLATKVGKPRDRMAAVIYSAPFEEKQDTNKQKSCTCLRTNERTATTHQKCAPGDVAYLSAVDNLAKAASASGKLGGVAGVLVGVHNCANMNKSIGIISIRP